MGNRYEHVTMRHSTRVSTRETQSVAAHAAHAAEPDEVGDVEDDVEAEGNTATVGTALLELQMYMNLSREQVLAMDKENLGEQRVESIMSMQFATNDAVMSPNTEVAKLALALGLRSHVVLCLFFHTTVHTSVACFKALRSWTKRRLRLRLRLLQLQAQERAGEGDRNKGKANEKSKPETNSKTKTKPKPQLQPMLPGDFVSSGMYELVLQARRSRLKLEACEDTIFAMSRLQIATFTPADFREAQALDLTLADREASVERSPVIDPDDEQDEEDIAEEVGLGQDDEQDQEEAAKTVEAVTVEIETAEARQPNIHSYSHRQPDRDEGQDDGDDEEETGASRPYTIKGTFASDADGIYEGLGGDESSAAFIETARGDDHLISEELGGDEGETALLHTDDESPSPSLSSPRHSNTPVVTINTSSPIRTGRATTSGKRPLAGSFQDEEDEEDAVTSPAKRTRVEHLGQSGSSHNPWHFATARDCGSVPDDQRLATNQCLTDSIVNVMCEFAAAHLPRAHFVSSLTMSAAARDAIENPDKSVEAKAAHHKIPEVQDISRLITVAHKRIGDGDSGAGGHYVWVMADTVYRVVYIADSLATGAPDTSKDMSRVALAGINLLHPPPAPSPPSPAPPWSVQSLECPQQMNDVDCGLYTIVTCLRVAAAGPKEFLAITTMARPGHEGRKKPTASLADPLPACRNMRLWRAIVLAMLRNARLWPILCELKVVLGVVDSDGDDNLLLQTQEDFRIPAKTSTRTRFDLLQRELDRVRDIRAQCTARSRALQSVLEDLDAAVGQVLEPLQRRWRICKLGTELKIRKLEGARARIEQAIRLTDEATLGIRTSSLSPACSELAGVLNELRLLRRRQVYVSSALSHGHARLRALELKGCRELLSEAISRYRDAAGEE